MKLKIIILVLSFFAVVYALIMEDSKQPVLTSNELIEKMKKSSVFGRQTEGEVSMPAQKNMASVKTFFKIHASLWSKHISRTAQ